MLLSTSAPLLTSTCVVNLCAAVNLPLRVGKLSVKTKEELALLKDCDQVWNVVGVLNYLQVRRCRLTPPSG